MPGDNKTIIGKNKYTNAWPIFHYFDPKQLTYAAEMVTEVPAYLNQRMSEGSMDVGGAISSFAYGMLSDQLLLLPELSVTSNGPVKSVLLFSKLPIEELSRGTIALTNTSATSVNLLHILLCMAYDGSPSYLTTEPDLDNMMEVADGALLIGDNAIKASWRDHGYNVYDLGEMWKSWTGHSMTFAVWAVNRQSAEQKPEAIEEIVKAFQQSKLRSQRNMKPVVQEAYRRIGGTEIYWEQYFNNLLYDFGSTELEGLRLYFRYAHELGLLPQEVTTEIWHENKLIRVKE